MPVAWNIYLAARPDKKQIRRPLILYVCYLVISLGSGQRSTAMLGILFLFCVFRISPGTESGRGLDHEEDGDNRSTGCSAAGGVRVRL